MTQAISEPLANGCIVEHSVPPFCVNPLSVAEGKRLRLVIDLRHVNSFLVRFKFKYEDLRSLSQVLEEGQWFFTWDLKSGYHHVDICLEHQMYLSFSWPFSGMLRYFTFTVLPFGLSSACFCFTKLLRPLVSRWRSMGHNSFIYLDDGLGSRPDKCSAAAAAMIQKKEPDLACVFSLMWHVLRPDLANFRPDEAFVWPVVVPWPVSFTGFFQFANLLGVGKLINAAQPTIAFGISSSDTDIALLYELALFISFTLCFVFQMF